MDNGTFRAAFPEFADVSRYPDSMLTLWSTFATTQVNVDRWGTQAYMGIYLYVAHEITLAGQNAATAANGGVPGGQSGPVNSKTVGSVTAGYDTTQGAEKDAGYWNGTIYGRQFLRLARMFGAGCVQL